MSDVKVAVSGGRASQLWKKLRRKKYAPMCVCLNSRQNFNLNECFLYMWLSGLVDLILMLEQDLHRLHILLGNCMEEGVPGLHPVLQQQLHHFQILIINCHEEGGPAQWIRAIYVDVARLRGSLEHSTQTRAAKQRNREKQKNNYIFVQRPDQNQL